MTTQTRDAIVLEDIVLEEVSLEEFRRYEYLLGKGPRPIRDDMIIFAGVMNPIVDTDYEHLLSRLCDVPQGYKVNVRLPNGRWTHVKTRVMCTREIHEVAQLAAQDSYHSHYLEFDLSAPFGDWHQTARIAFKEMNGGIVGYKVDVPDASKHLFTIRASRPFSAVRGLYVPQATQQDAASEGPRETFAG